MLAEDLDMVDKRAGTKLPHGSGQKHAQQAGLWRWARTTAHTVRHR